MSHDLALPSVVDRILHLRRLAEPLIVRIRSDAVDLDLLRDLRALAVLAGQTVTDAATPVSLQLVGGRRTGPPDSRAPGRRFRPGGSLASAARR